MTHGDYMAGLSSVMAITRPLGNVSLAAMNRCVGVYRVYLVGSGGGGGGYDDVYLWYGGAGDNGVVTTYSGGLVPPMGTTAGAGGSPGVTPAEAGAQGGQAVMTASRGVVVSATGGDGGASAIARKSPLSISPELRVGKVTDRFTISFFTTYPPAPAFVVTTGRGGDSAYPGYAGGIIRAFRIG